MTEQIAYRPSGKKQEVKMSDVDIEQGELTMIVVATGHVHVADDTASEKMGGPALQTRENAAGVAGEETIEIDTGGALLWMQYNLGKPTTAAQVDLSAGASGSLDTITIDTVEVLNGAVAFDTDLATTAANAIEQINQSQGIYYAYLSGTAEINIVERIVTRATLTIVSTSTTITSDDTNASGGNVLAQTDLGDDLYAVDGRKATQVAGNVVIGTVERIDDPNDDPFEAVAAIGRVAITGGVGSISQIDAGSTNLMGNNINFTTSPEVTAGLIRDDINLLVNTHFYFAEVDGDEVVIFQTTDVLDEEATLLTVTGSLANTVTQNIVGGEVPRVLVDLNSFGD